MARSMPQGVHEVWRLYNTIGRLLQERWGPLSFLKNGSRFITHLPHLICGWHVVGWRACRTCSAVAIEVRNEGPRSDSTHTRNEDQWVPSSTTIILVSNRLHQTCPRGLQHARTEYGRSPLGYGSRPLFGYEYHWRRVTMACLAKLIHMALQLERCGRKSEILESHVPHDKAWKDDYHIEWLGRLPETMIMGSWKFKRRGPWHHFRGLDQNGHIRLPTKIRRSGGHGFNPLHSIVASCLWHQCDLVLGFFNQWYGVCSTCITPF